MYPPSVLFVDPRQRPSSLFWGLIAFVIVLTFPLLVFSKEPQDFPPSASKEIKILKEFSGSLNTVNLGVETSRPPYIRIFHTMEGLQFQISEFGKIRERHTQEKVRQLAKEIRPINFEKDMVIGIFSFPTDNYGIRVHKLLDIGNRIEVHLSYDHQDQKYQILPPLRIFYSFLVIPKTPYPLVLKAKPVKAKKDDRSPQSLQTISGKLRRMENMESVLGLSKKVKNKEYLYYIREPRWKEVLTPYIGKTVVVKGYVFKKQESIYEAEIKIVEVLKK